MLRKPTDADGIVVPRTDPEAAWDAVSGLTVLARSMRSATEALDIAAGGVCWSGDAADRYRTVRERLSRRTAELAEVASAGAGVVLDWLREAAPALAAMRSVATRIEDLGHRADAAAAGAYDPVVDARLSADLDAAYRDWHRARDTYWQAAETAARRFVALRDGVTDRRLDVRDQVEGAATTLWRGGVVGPVTDLWNLTGRAVTDPEAWWRTVSGLPAATVDAAVAALTDPRAAVSELSDADAWEHGRYGEATAAVVTLFLPGPGWLRGGRDLGRVRFARNLADPRAPRPVLQTTDELIAGVDLTRHEHARLGHTLRRHVDVDDDYLMDRLVHGTLLDDGSRGDAPGAASRFTDRATAERAITEALRRNQIEIAEFVEHGPAAGQHELWISYDSREPLGDVMTRAPGGFTVSEGHHARVALRIGPDGPYLYTAFLA